MYQGPIFIFLGLCQNLGLGTWDLLTHLTLSDAGVSRPNTWQVGGGRVETAPHHMYAPNFALMTTKFFPILIITRTKILSLKTTQNSC